MQSSRIDMKLIIAAKISLWLELILAMALFTAGCGQNPASSRKFDTPASGTKSPEAEAQAQGTVDGGGGAGFKGKPLESYRRSIEDLSLFPEFKVVDEVLKSIERVNPDHAKIFRHIVRDRIWLFLNEPIPKISESRQGAPYIIDQWAVQNSKEIWISDQYRGEDSAKAKILLHEILVGLKIMRFLSYNEYCYQWTSDRALCDAGGNKVLIPDYKLTALDHADVRNMGEWLWQHHATMSADDFGYQMHVKQFQGPNYSWKPLSSFLLEDRVLNPVIDRLNERIHELFTDWGADFVARKKCVIQFTPDFPNRRMHVSVEVKELKSGKVTGIVKYDLEYDRQKEQHASLRAGDHGRSLGWFATDGNKMKRVGDKGTKVSIELVNESVVEFYGGESQVVEIKDGVPSSVGDNRGPRGTFCDESPIQLPTQMWIWLEMRDSDRELLERRRYNGKTLRELEDTISQSPEYRLNP